MTDEERLRRLLQSALPKTSDEGPARDLWPVLVTRMDRAAHTPWLWIDLGLAAAVGAALAVVPEWVLLLLYHL